MFAVKCKYIITKYKSAVHCLKSLCSRNLFIVMYRVTQVSFPKTVKSVYYKSKAWNGIIQIARKMRHPKAFRPEFCQVLNLK